MARRIDDQEGIGALERWASGHTLGRAERALAVRWSLQELARLAPGHAVEVRVPPFGAVQAIAGSKHRRGTPPAVIEMGEQTWLELVTGQATWEQAVASGAVSASGARATLADHLPLHVI